MIWLACHHFKLPCHLKCLFTVGFTRGGFLASHRQDWNSSTWITPSCSVDYFPWTTVVYLTCIDQHYAGNASSVTSITNTTSSSSDVRTLNSNLYNLYNPLMWIHCIKLDVYEGIFLSALGSNGSLAHSTQTCIMDSYPKKSLRLLRFPLPPDCDMHLCAF